MARTKKDNSRLGQGLSAIFGEDIESVLDDIQQGVNEDHGSGKIEIAVEEIKPNPYQPRKQFDDTKINELADSIRLHGVFTPNNATSPCFANHDRVFPLTAMIFAPLLFSVSTVAFNSLVSPLLDIAITTSPASTCPLLPCTASVACSS